MTELLKPLARFVEAVAIAANAVGTLVVLGLVLVVNYDMAARNAANAPFQGAREVVQFSMILIVFLQLPDVVRVNRLTRSDGFLVVLGGGYPGLAVWLRRIINAFSAIFMILIAHAIWPEFLKMWASGDYFGIPGIFTAPWWPVKLTIFLSAVLTALLFLFKATGILPDVYAAHVPSQEDAA